MIDLNFHQGAINNFEEKSTELLQQLFVKSPDIKSDSFKSQVPIMGELKKEDIVGDLISSILDSSGEELAIFFHHNDKEIGFFNESFKNFIRLCENVQKVSSVKDYVSFKTIKKVVFDWTKEKYKGKTKDGLINYIKNKIDSEIVEREYWIPIFGTEIEKEFQFCNILFTTLGKEKLDNWLTQLLEEKSQKEIEEITKSFIKTRKEIEGYAVAVIKITAEQERGSEKAFEEVESAISYMRLFSEATFFPKITSQFTVLGKQKLEMLNYYTVIENRLSFLSKGTVDHSYKPWRISFEFYNSMMKDGLKMIENIYLKKNKTEFDKKVLDSIKLYSNSLLLHNLSDRLVYVLVSLESLLLKNRTESIQDNVGRRLAFFISSERLARKEISTNFKDVYSIRSDFIHHANKISIDQLDILKKFFYNIWLFYFNLLLRSEKYDTKDKFIDAIEDRIYS